MKKINHIFNILIALVWFANGFFCKILNLVPRHQQIVARILGESHAVFFTKIIGVSEIIISVWIVSKYKSRINTIAQIIIILAMNILEFFIAPDLLMWGKLNIVFAFIFITIIYFNGFKLNSILVK